MFRKSVIVLLIVVWPGSMVLGDVFFFTDQGVFEQFNATHGKTLKGIETYEEGFLPAGLVEVPLNDPLEWSIPNIDPGTGGGFPTGLDEPNLKVQSNMGPNPNPPDPNPRGLRGLRLVGPPLANSLVVTTSPFNEDDSLDLLFTEPNHTGVGFDVVSSLAGVAHLAIYNKQDDEIGKYIMTVVGQLSKTFFGVWSDETIGRINIWVSGGAAEGADNIQMWVPEPATFALLSLGGAVALGSRRRGRASRP